MFKKKTVDAALASFKKVMLDLQQVANNSQEEIDRLNEEMSQKEIAVSEATVEKNRAESVLSKLEKLLES